MTADLSDLVTERLGDGMDPPAIAMATPGSGPTSTRLAGDAAGRARHDVVAGLGPQFAPRVVDRPGSRPVGEKSTPNATRSSVSNVPARPPGVSAGQPRPRWRTMCAGSVAPRRSVPRRRGVDGRAAIPGCRSSMMPFWTAVTTASSEVGAAGPGHPLVAVAPGGRTRTSAGRAGRARRRAARRRPAVNHSSGATTVMPSARVVSRAGTPGRQRSRRDRRAVRMRSGCRRWHRIRGRGSSVIPRAGGRCSRDGHADELGDVERLEDGAVGPAEAAGDDDADVVRRDGGPQVLPVVFREEGLRLPLP